MTGDAMAGGSKENRICLFGGTFDPIHRAHLEIAAVAAREFQLDRVLFVPAAHPPHKQHNQITSFHHRFRMVELACVGYPEFEPSRLEETQGTSYTIDTVEHLKGLLSTPYQLSFLIGFDAFNDIQSWHRWQDLVRELDFLVVSRPGVAVKVAPGARVQYLDEIALPYSSTEVRERLARGEATPELPTAVRAYIDEHRLYRYPQQG